MQKKDSFDEELFDVKQPIDDEDMRVCLHCSDTEIKASFGSKRQLVTTTLICNDTNQDDRKNDGTLSIQPSNLDTDKISSPRSKKKNVNIPLLQLKLIVHLLK